MIQQEYVFLSASQYSMVDKETGEQIQGTSVHLAPVNPSNNPKEAGAKPQKFNAPYESFTKVYSKLEYLQQYSFDFEARAVGTSVKLALVGLSQ